MKSRAIPSGKRETISVSVDAGIINAARDAGVDFSGAIETALDKATRAALDKQWRIENKEWIDADRHWVEANGLPLERYRMF